MKKTRVMVVRLFGGGYLARDGRSNNDPVGQRTVRVQEADAYRFLSAMRLSGVERHSDLLWGASLEMLDKRKRHTCLTDAEFRQFLGTMKNARLVAQADKFDRLAAGYRSQAVFAEKMAEDMRERAARLRASLAAADQSQNVP